MITLGNDRLTFSDVSKVARGEAEVTISKEALSRIKKAHDFIKSEINSGNTHYGINTGFGYLSKVKIPEEQLAQLQVNILRSHATGVGPSLPKEIIRAMMFLRAADLARGHSGVRVEIIQRLVDMLNADVVPSVPEQGSLGASGDLAPLAHMALHLIGDGELLESSKSKKKFEPIKLGPKEGLSLINGTQMMSAFGCTILDHAGYLADLADAIAAMSLEALLGTSAAFDSKIHDLRPHPGQKKVAERLRSLLSPPSEIAKSHANCDKVQDPYSLRCVPQVHGACRDTIDHVRKTFEIEINSVTDNPLVFSDAGEVISGGNFHGEYLAFGFDFMSIALSELASISEQRISKLVNPALSELPAFLIKDSGINSGFMIVHYAAASVVSENKTLSHPASVDSIPTSADKEDHVSMGAWGARKCFKILENTRRVLAMELLCASQGIDLRRPLKSTPKIEKLHQAVRLHVPKASSDRTFYQDVHKLEALIQNKTIGVDL